jgi:hypothetical protein
MTQLALPLALRDRGMSLAAQAQDADAPGWSDLALAEISRLARLHETLFTDDLAPFLTNNPARHFNALGAIWLRAVRAGVIERTEYRRQSADPKKHAHSYPVYRSRVFSK